ncbi:hypothetical protein [Crocosphaera sp.]|uniref:hypothetical protein n=1 Tax=Crocosphaera sp. TaxID=2729996 RepID=UPI002628D8A2|nr:hypothetical protein [Crocosphaera sp.]MDJ0579068.1 hypothetical protein [Crocosphaera sp.]
MNLKQQIRELIEEYSLEEVVKEIWDYNFYFQGGWMSYSSQLYGIINDLDRKQKELEREKKKRQATEQQEAFEKERKDNIRYQIERYYFLKGQYEEKGVKMPESMYEMFRPYLEANKNDNY